MSKKSQKAFETLNEILSETHPEVQRDLLFNMLTMETHQGRTVAEMLKRELEAKNWVENYLAEAKEKREAVA